MTPFRELLTARTAERGALARLARISRIHPVVIKRWTESDVAPRPPSLKKLAPALGLPYDTLMQLVYPDGEPIAIPIEEQDETTRWAAALKAALADVPDDNKPHAGRAAEGAIRAFIDPNARYRSVVFAAA